MLVVSRRFGLQASGGTTHLANERPEYVGGKAIGEQEMMVVGGFQPLPRSEDLRTFSFIPRLSLFAICLLGR